MQICWLIQKDSIQQNIDNKALEVVGKLNVPEFMNSKLDKKSFDHQIL